MELFEEFKAHEEKMASQVFIADGHIVINVEYEYNIDLQRCNTPEKLLHWIWHLTEKTWMTNDVMRRFIQIACKENKIEMAPA